MGAKNQKWLKHRPTFRPTAPPHLGKTRSYHRGLASAWLFLAVLVFGLTLAIRIRLLGIPLERDEGEYAYAGQLMLQGIPPYKLAYNMKFPGVYAAYAGIMSIFGQTIWGIHLGLLVINIATVALIFLLGRRLLNFTCGITAAASYAVLSLSPSVLGLAGHATNFVVLPMVAGLLLLLPDQSNRRPFLHLFASGLLFGLSVMMKQPGIFFALFGAIYLTVKSVRGQLGLKQLVLQIVTFGLGVVLPFGITCLWLLFAGVFSQFWFWTVDYAFQYASGTPLSKGAHDFFDIAKDVITASWLLCGLAVFGLFAGTRFKKARPATGLILGLLFFSGCALCPGLHFRPHYFILLLPAVALLIGLAIDQLCELAAPRRIIGAQVLPLCLLAAGLGLPLLQKGQIFFRASPVEVCRIIYGANPFPESVRIAQYLREHTDPRDTIAVVGSEPQIYFYSHRHSATGYIYTYGLVERQPYARRMQQEMIAEISQAAPKYIAFVAIEASWLKSSGSENTILSWFNDYARQNYTLTGLVNLVSPTQTDYYFDQVPNSPPPGSAKWIVIYQRNS